MSEVSLPERMKNTRRSVADPPPVKEVLEDAVFPVLDHEDLTDPGVLVVACPEEGRRRKILLLEEGPRSALKNMTADLVTKITLEESVPKIRDVGLPGNQYPGL